MASQWSLFFAALVLLSVMSCAHSRLTKQQEAEVLAAHNNARAIAEPKPCGPLSSLVWSTELASVAQNYSEKCDASHNNDRTTDQTTFRYVGENLYFSTGSTPNPAAGVVAWDDEKNYYTLTTKTCSKEPCGHYTQLVWNGTTHVGCGAHTCPANTIKNLGSWGQGRAVYILTCNYGPGGNVNSRQAYQTCPDQDSSAGRLALTPLSQATLCAVLIIVAAVTYISL